MVKFDAQFEIDSPTGASLNAYRFQTSETPVGIVHVSHGLAEHASRYAEFARAVSKSGFHVYAHDHRGHGFTKATDAPQGTFSQEGNGVDKALRDCAAIQDHASSEHPRLPVVMFGHSMGGLITMNFALRNPDRLAGAAVWNSNFDGGLAGRLAQLLLKYERMRLGSDVPSRIIPKLTFQTWAKQIKDRRTDFDWLSNVTEEVDAYIADPLCGWDASVGLWLNVFDMIYAGANVPGPNQQFKHLPIFLLGGEKDPASNFAKATANQLNRLRKSGCKHTSAHIFPNARHETLNDLDREEATAKFIEFARYACRMKSEAQS